MGHGGSQHKKAPGLVARARKYVTSLGFAAAAIDAPSQGDRPTSAQAARFATEIRQRITEGGSVGALVAREMARRAVQAVPEWRATLDALQTLDFVGEGPVGYWGLSMGSAIGLPLVAAEPRIAAAVLGLAGLLSGDGALAETAAKVTVPVQFVLQWDDELVPRESGLALFDALASGEKTLHANPGRHSAVPPFELAEAFFARHLAEDGAR
ncbi:alpha/beta hydrolase [Nonomuraea sp. NPDC000554]|uniref:dienelactone hydrolase family protein n=1 Tax=Nonomuraea sp. NPDC000554 TaxID=3154259 RepID=UPI0033245D62